jgi:hypothetical protein
MVNDLKCRSSHGMRNECQLSSGLAGEHPSLLSSFHKAELFLIPRQNKARTWKEPMEPFQLNVHLVAHPVGSYTHLVNQMLQSYEDTARNRCESGWTFSMQHADGKLAECWDANTGLRASCPNLQPKNDGPKVRHDFHFLASCVEYTSFFKQKMHDRFRLLAMKLPLQKRSEAKEILLVPTLSPKSDHRA